MSVDDDDDDCRCPLDTDLSLLSKASFVGLFCTTPCDVWNWLDWLASISGQYDNLYGANGANRSECKSRLTCCLGCCTCCMHLGDVGLIKSTKSLLKQFLIWFWFWPLGQTGNNNVFKSPILSKSHNKPMRAKVKRLLNANRLVNLISLILFSIFKSFQQAKKPIRLTK